MKRGVYTAIVTPFKPGGGVDEKAFRKLIELQIKAGVTGLVVSGSTGEGQTQTLEEWHQALDLAMEYRDQIQIVGSCGSSGTAQTIERFKRMAAKGPHAALVSSPSYNKPPQRGILKHFEEIAKTAPNLEIIVYNIPGRTAVNILPETLQELWKIPSVAAVKESSGDGGQVTQVFEERPQGKLILCGEDPLNADFFKAGGDGAVSVLSNVLPKAVVQQWQAAQNQDWETVNAIQSKVSDLIALLFCESNPIPVKWLAGEIIGESLSPRLPLVDLDEKYQAKLKESWSQLT